MFRKLDVCKSTTKPKCDWSKLGFGYDKPLPCKFYIYCKAVDDDIKYSKSKRGFIKADSR